ncbi:hypothetical protein B0T16DRAFT_59803 [Cercophora newfieldiana]|uniref:Uncharacterized protein n=1 Tax=Cercophora newfieldiana TaxID=92897 RepID=A0AA39YRP2_9PEZI|nr:hypothetical protein B0T16DRAFT_59803 [Cercophora newfieldiana]
MSMWVGLNPWQKSMGLARVLTPLFAAGSIASTARVWHNRVSTSSHAPAPPQFATPSTKTDCRPHAQEPSHLFQRRRWVTA